MRSYQFEQNVTSTGLVNVTVEARNAVSSTKTWTSIFYYFLINGFYIQNNATVQTIENASISLKIASNAAHPQGDMDVLLFFGDGSSKCFNISSDDPNLVSGGLYFEKTYEYQGVYQIQASLSSHVGTSNVSSEIQIWDKLDVELKSKTIAITGEEIVFEFINVTNSNFQYRIDYGDGKIKENNETDLARRYDFKNWTKSYQSDKTFSIIFKAWNPMYNKTNFYNVLIENPLINSSVVLSPVNDTIPIPDGQMNFTLNIADRSAMPTNVKCNFDWDEGDGSYDISVKTVLFQKTYTFKTSGIKNVSVHCWNNVSSVFKTSKIILLNYTLKDIEVIFKSPVNMNMTLESHTPTPDNRMHFKAVSIPVEVEFQFDFLTCSRLPQNVIMNWNFGDGTSDEKVNSTNLSYSHVFKTRDKFRIQLHIEDVNENTSSTRNLTLQTGILTFNVNPNKGDLRDTVFKMSATGLLGETTSYIISANSSNINQTGNSFSYNNVTEVTKYESYIMYEEIGYYLPKLTGSNGSLTETIFLDYPIIADLNISHGGMILDVPDSVPLPPGSVEYKLKIATPENSSRPHVNCTIHTGDAVNRDPIPVNYNITWKNPLLSPFKYIALGKPELSITCINSISTETWNKSILVYNPAFEIKGIFDRQYSTEKSPLSVWTSDHFYISNRMAVWSNTSETEFQWNLYNNSTFSKNWTSSTLFIMKGTLDPDLYCLNLTVKLPHTSIFEYIYIRFISPKPFAYITGGSMVSKQSSPKAYTQNISEVNTTSPEIAIK